MPIEIKEVADFLGVKIEETTTLDDLKSQFNTKFVTADKVNTAVGEITGKAVHALKKGFKEIGLEVDAAELKDKAITEIPTIFANAAKAKFDEYEKTKGLTTEQAEAKYKGDLDKAHKQITDLNGLLDTTKNEFTNFKTEVVTKERKGAISREFESVVGKLKFSESVPALAIKGFKADLSESFQFDIDDATGKPVVRDANGELVKSKAKHGEYATYEEVITEKFVASKLGAVVDSKKVPNFGAPTPQYTPPATGQRQVAPRH